MAQARGAGKAWAEGLRCVACGRESAAMGSAPAVTLPIPSPLPPGAPAGDRVLRAPPGDPGGARARPLRQGRAALRAQAVRQDDAGARRGGGRGRHAAGPVAHHHERAVPGQGRDGQDGAHGVQGGEALRAVRHPRRPLREGEGDALRLGWQAETPLLSVPSLSPLGSIALLRRAPSLLPARSWWRTASARRRGARSCAWTSPPTASRRTWPRSTSSTPPGTRSSS